MRDIKDLCANFNPHSHAGSDSGYTVSQVDTSISIHTPTQGVTEFATSSGPYVRHFNPHSHAGSDRLRQNYQP